jgi:hypothetical protein
LTLQVWLTLDKSERNQQVKSNTRMCNRDGVSTLHSGTVNVKTNSEYYSEQWENGDNWEPPKSTTTA